MKEFIEVRLGWPAAARVFRPDEGEHLSDRIFKITLRTSDPRLREIAALRSEKDFVYGWDIIRRYSSSELDGAHAFVLAITAMFEPEGESCGTEYDWSGACADCGAGRRVAGSLRLDLTRLPRSKDVAQSIAGDEWVVSQRLAEILVAENVTGAGLRPVLHRRQDDYWEAVSLRKYRSGREILARARDAGFSATSPSLWVWVRAAAQRPLVEALYAELDERAVRSRPGRQLPAWYQLTPTGQRVAVDTASRFGVNPFDGESAGRSACGHVLGLNRLSELSIRADSWSGADFSVTDACVGERQGVLVPHPLMVVSQRFRKILEQHKVRGYGIEIAHLR